MAAGSAGPRRTKCCSSARRSSNAPVEEEDERWPRSPFPWPSVTLVAVGKRNAGPNPQMRVCGAEGDRKNVGFMSPNAARATGWRHDIGLVCDWGNPPCDQIDAAEIGRNHRLNVHHILHAAVGPDREIRVVLKRHADQVGDWILRFFRSSSSLGPVGAVCARACLTAVSAQASVTANTSDLVRIRMALHGDGAKADWGLRNVEPRGQLNVSRRSGTSPVHRRFGECDDSNCRGILCTVGVPPRLC